MVIWSLVFAAPHVYWALGGRAGLAGQAAEAEAAFEQTWFAAYNLVAALLAIAGAVVSVVLTRGPGGPRLRRYLLMATAAGGVALLARGALGMTLLAVGALQGGPEDPVPLILLAIEPWFLVGGLAYGGLTLIQRSMSRRNDASPAPPAAFVGD